MKGKNVKRIVIAVALLAVLAISGIYAYFTDGDTASNIFTVGNIDIEITEQSWNPLNENYMTPKQELPKNPQIINYGENDAYVFMEVVTPYANVETANEDGTKNAAADTELFSYVINTDDGWVQVGHTEKNIKDNTITRRYAYAAGDAMTVLEASETEEKNATPALFDTIKLANIIEGQGLTGTSQDIVVNAYAIQTDNINDGNTTNLDGNNNDGKTAPADVWEVLFNQRMVDYKPLECIQSSGTQYIDTGVEGGNIKYSADIVFDSIGSGWEGVLSEELLDGPYYNQAGPRIHAGIWTSCSATTEGTVNANVGTKYNLEGSTEAGKTYLDVNGTRVDSNTNTTFAPYTLTIFGNNRGSTVNQLSSMKLFGLTLSDLDGRLIRNFVPCELLQDLPESKCADASLPHTEGTIGLWDTVEGKFYTNKGTGEFISGYYVADGIVPLGYIESTGTQYIDTGVEGGNIKYSADIVFTSLGSGWVSVLSEENKSEPYKQAGPRIKDGKWASSGSVGSVNAKAGTRYYLEGSTEAGNTYLDVNGARVVSNTNTTFAPYTLTIFGNNNGTTVGQRSSIKLYGLTLSDLDGRLIRNFVPCELLQDLPESKCADASLPHTKGTVGLWDTVEDKFYTNKGTGDFIPGYYVLDNYVLDDYVHDSANLILDGIWNSAEGVHSDTLAAGWVDLSGNCKPTLLGTANTVGTNCITSDGTNSGKMTVQDVDPINLTEFTLEVIYKRGSNYQDNQVILGRNHTSSYYVNTAKNRLTVWIGRQTQDVATGTDYTKTYTLQLTCTGNSATAWVDGVKTKENFLANAKKANDKLMLFGNPENGYRFIGSIMAVRIHNRVLSDEELAQNYEIDKKRFGL